MTRSTPTHTAVIHLTVPKSQIRQVMHPGLQELMSTLAAQHIQPAGPWFTHHRRMSPDQFDFEISIPIPMPVAPSGRVQASHLPEVQIARTTYHGPYEGLAQAWGEFRTWIKDHNHTPAENLWECYVAGPESSSDPAKWRTQLNQPLVDEASIPESEI